MHSNMAAQHAPPSGTPNPDTPFQVLLEPLAHPQLDAIRIEEDLFAIGRSEPPFVTYGKALTSGMSRRHARIFSERGAVYVADLGSKNGTTVNGTRIQQKPAKLRKGDELCFGGDLCFRVELIPPPQRAAHPPHCVCLTLTPDRDDLGLQPIVITSFPFLISKADEAIARYRADYPHQVNYISRRHAHIFLKRGAPFIEDLGSTNGTFVDGTRLDEHAVALTEGCTLAFGGSHFVYRVGIQEASELTLTRVAGLDDEDDIPPPDADKTTFVAAADSFLDIFCVDHPPPPDEAEDEAAEAGNTAEAPPARQRPPWLVFLSQLREAFGRREGGGHWLRWTGVLVVVAVAGGVALYHQGAPQRTLSEHMAQSDYAGAARLAADLLAAQPDDTQLQALGTEAVLRAHVPQWSELLAAGSFDRAASVLSEMRDLAAPNPDARPLIDELAWVSALARFVAEHGGLDAPVAIFDGEDPARALIDRWESDPRGHQHALSRVATLIPEFKAPYAQALSQLRRLESDASVYRGAVDRLKSTLDSRLQAGDLDGVSALLREYAETYPRLTGVAALRTDLATYRALEADTATASLAVRLDRFAAAQFTTPPFTAALARLRAERLPADAELDRYRDAQAAWRAGDSARAITTLEALATGRWGDALADELAHRKAIAARFAAVGTADTRAGAGRDDLLALVAVLDPVDDRYFLDALAPALAKQREAAIAYADTRMKAATSAWAQYRADGPISDSERRELQVSAAFRSRAEALGRAQREADRALHLLRAVDASPPDGFAHQRQAIADEVATQRRALQDLRDDLDADRLADKLALIGGQGDEK